jgi:hypothetical protein
MSTTGDPYPVLFNIKSNFTVGPTAYALRIVSGGGSDTLGIREDGHAEMQWGDAYGYYMRGYSAGFFMSGGNGDPSSIGVYGYDGVEGWRFQQVGYSGASSSFDFHSRGDIVAFSSVPSDNRLKKDLNFFENSLDSVAGLTAYSFVWKHDGSSDVGFIAQEVELIFPNLIKEKYLPLQTNRDHVLYKTMSYEKLIPYLVESVKELKRIVESQKAEIDQLKERL